MGKAQLVGAGAALADRTEAASVRVMGQRGVPRRVLVHRSATKRAWCSTAQSAPPRRPSPDGRADRPRTPRRRCRRSPRPRPAARSPPSATIKLALVDERCGIPRQPPQRGERGAVAATLPVPSAIGRERPDDSVVVAAGVGDRRGDRACTGTRRLGVIAADPFERRPRRGSGRRRARSSCWRRRPAPSPSPPPPALAPRSDRR